MTLVSYTKMLTHLVNLLEPFGALHLLPCRKALGKTAKAWLQYELDKHDKTWFNRLQTRLKQNTTGSASAKGEGDEYWARMCSKGHGRMQFLLSAIAATAPRIDSNGEFPSH